MKNKVSSIKNLATANLESIACRYHPSHPLHTFCLDKKCMLPMCSQCISLHNQEHRESSTFGIYKSISQLNQEALADISHGIHQLEEINDNYLRNYDLKNRSIDKCKLDLNELRAKTHDKIELLFDEIELQLQKKIQTHNEKMHQLYMSLESRVQSKYRQLQSDEGILNIRKRNSFDSFYSTNHSKRSENEEGDVQSSESAQQYKFMKKLIEYYGKQEMKSNGIEIEELRKEVEILEKEGRIQLQVEKERIKQIVSKIQQFVKVGVGAKDEEKKKRKDYQMMIYEDDEEEGEQGEQGEEESIGQRTKGMTKSKQVSPKKQKAIAFQTGKERVKEEWDSLQSIKSLPKPQQTPTAIRQENRNEVQRRSFLKNGANEGSTVSIIASLQDYPQPQQARYLSPQPQFNSYRRPNNNPQLHNQPHIRTPSFESPLRNYIP